MKEGLEQSKLPGYASKPYLCKGATLTVVYKFVQVLDYDIRMNIHIDLSLA